MLYDRYGSPGASAIAVPGVAESEDQDPDDVAPIMVPLAKSAYPVTATVLLRQVNRFLDEGGRPQVVGLSQWAINLNGVLVYCPQKQPHSALAAQVSAIEALGKLMAHPVRWWSQRSWDGRPVWYQGVPARITHYWPERGQCGLVAEDGAYFVPQGQEIEAGIAPEGAERQVMMVDILSTEVTWNRTKARPAPAHKPSADTQDDAPVVESQGESTGGEDG